MKMSRFVLQVAVCFFILLSSLPCYARMVTQLMPILTLSEEYTDNYLKTESNEQDEYITTVKLGFGLSFLEKKHKLYLNYDPMYKLYDKNSKNDGLDHTISLNGTFQPEKLSFLKYGANFTKTEVDREGESRSSGVSGSGNFQLGKNTSFTLSQDFSRSFDQQVDSGSWTETDTNNSTIGITHRFGQKNSAGVHYAYKFTEYETLNANDFNSHTPSVFFSYWFTPLFGLDTNFSYETVNFDLTNNNEDTYSGDIRLIRKLTKHFSMYVKYRQTHSDQRTDKHDTYYPSIGFDWEPTEDSGISLGGGVIFQEYDTQTNYEKEKPFIDIDMYKIFKLTRRSTLSVTGASGYGETDTEAASLGFNIYYQAGFDYTYQLAKRVTTNLAGSYKLKEYDEVGIDRKDTTAKISADLDWKVLKWLNLSLGYSMSDFDSDAGTRDNYTENRVTFKLEFIPTTPIRMQTSPTRKLLEDKLFN